MSREIMNQLYHFYRIGPILRNFSGQYTRSLDVTLVYIKYEYKYVAKALGRNRYGKLILFKGVG